MVSAKRRERDRRVRKTQNLLHEALFSLIHERDFDSIAVKEILHRADVGRSTFYSHFRDKEELLLSGIRATLGSFRPISSPARSCAQLIWFSLPLFRHIDQLRRSGKAVFSPRSRTIVHDRLRAVLAELISDDVNRSLRTRGDSSVPPPADVVVRHVVSTFVLVLDWWLESATLMSPEQANDLYRRLIIPTLAAICPD